MNGKYNYINNYNNIIITSCNNLEYIDVKKVDLININIDYNIQSGCKISISSNKSDNSQLFYLLEKLTSLSEFSSRNDFSFTVPLRCKKSKNIFLDFLQSYNYKGLSKSIKALRTIPSEATSIVYSMTNNKETVSIANNNVMNVTVNCYKYDILYQSFLRYILGTFNVIDKESLGLLYQYKLNTINISPEAILKMNTVSSEQIKLIYNNGYLEIHSCANFSEVTSHEWNHDESYICNVSGDKFRRAINIARLLGKVSLRIKDIYSPIIIQFVGPCGLTQIIYDTDVDVPY
uniref:Uncharacterized protein n=1 Tax=viral metagenome TaxID=1070528 RepID=A0A6C0J755_9ZZZZ